MIGVDWGTTSFRAYRITREGTIRDSRAGPRGIMNVPDARFADTLREEIGPWLALHPGLRGNERNHDQCTMVVSNRMPNTSCKPRRPAGVTRNARVPRCRVSQPSSMRRRQICAPTKPAR